MRATQPKQQPEQPPHSNVHPVFSAILNLICPPPETLGRNQAVRDMLRKFEDAK
jgi:hypothetical protein